MKNQVKDIHVQQMVTRTQYDAEKGKLETTISVKTNIPVETVAQLIRLQKQGAPLYLTIESDQAQMSMTA